MKGVGEKPYNEQLDKKDLKNSDLNTCPVCLKNIPASIQFSRKIPNLEESRYETINVCHICSGLGQDGVWEQFDKNNKSKKK